MRFKGMASRTFTYDQLIDSAASYELEERDLVALRSLAWFVLDPLSHLDVAILKVHEGCERADITCDPELFPDLVAAVQEMELPVAVVRPDAVITVGIPSSDGYSGEVADA